MDMLDLIALTGLEWLYDIIEKRYGGAIAAVVALTLAVAILGVGVWIIARSLGR